MRTTLAAGGRIVAEGTPREVAKVKASYTGQYLKRYFEREKARHAGLQLRGAGSRSGYGRHVPRRPRGNAARVPVRERARTR